MSVRPILLWPDPRLAQVCDPVDATAVDALIGDLFDTMYAAKGRGLAAPQIGVMQRVFVVDVSWKEGNPNPRAFINPGLGELSDEATIVEEQCLSIPDLPMPVERPRSVKLSWKTKNNLAMTDLFDGALGRCILHELDHLDGRVIFDHQSATDRTKFEAQYAG